MYWLIRKITSFIVIDLKILFSFKPFILQDTKQFNIIVSNDTDWIKLDAKNTGITRKIEINQSARIQNYL